MPKRKRGRPRKTKPKSKSMIEEEKQKTKAFWDFIFESGDIIKKRIANNIESLTPKEEKKDQGRASLPPFLRNEGEK